MSKNEEQVSTELDDTLNQREEAISAKETDLSRLAIELNKRDVELAKQELAAKNGFPKLFEENFATFKKQLDQREAQCVSELKSIEAEKDKLRQRELKIRKAEIERDKGYADERKSLDEELLNLRKKNVEELDLNRANSLSAIQKEILAERSSRLSSLKKEIADELKVHKSSLEKEKDELSQKRENLLKDQAKLDELKNELEYQKQRLQSRKGVLEEREENLSVEIDSRAVERKRSFENEKVGLKDEIEILRESIKTSTGLLSNFEMLKVKLGDEDPSIVLLKLKNYEEEIKTLRDDLASRPTQEMQETYDRLKSETRAVVQEKDRYKEDYQNLYKSRREQGELEAEIDSLRIENKILTDQKSNIEAHNNELQAGIERLQSAYERKADAEERIRDIEAPFIEREQSRAKLPEKDERAKYELQWLREISQSCTDYGLRFPRRILLAFHTALKTSEWSPVTVLAGVSGTGKSELPRLYSHFGGINFLSLSVQPNWDSKESMIGFFNAMDNRFDAEPVLRLLVQSQKAYGKDYPLGLEDSVSLVLMDEMNLAHVELYFAEFLSKLELRRGLKGNEVPKLEVKLGAGIKPYELPLGRNVLWAGTMNQDETTKSLSDKVLDRGIVINFPRPTTLERRKKLKSLGDHAPLLSRKLWESWWCKESQFTDKEIKPFKDFVEEMNGSLSKVGKALGHRVWQSIEYYMANYPDVLDAQRNSDEVELKKAMKVAFEDQLVQKVMPKLRGIETRGKSKSDCLDKIRTQLVGGDYTIVGDFDLACEFGYGQFIWSTANYLKYEDNLSIDEEESEMIQQELVAALKNAKIEEK